MGKTQRSLSRNHNKSHRSHMNFHHVDCIDASYLGLHHWFKHLHEELGWMVLAQSYGMMDKIAVYKSSVKRFKCAIEHRIKNMRDFDKKEDLRIMHHNICVLLDHVEKDF